MCIMACSEEKHVAHIPKFCINVFSLNTPPLSKFLSFNYVSVDISHIVKINYVIFSYNILLSLWLNSKSLWNSTLSRISAKSAQISIYLRVYLMNVTVSSQFELHFGPVSLISIVRMVLGKGLIGRSLIGRLVGMSNPADDEVMHKSIHKKNGQSGWRISKCLISCFYIFS